MRKRFAVVFFAGLILVYGVFPVHGLDPRQPINSYLHDAWEIEDGLPQNAVMALVQTSDGYLWIGTQEGLVRFNGKDFEIFDKYNTGEIAHNYIRTLLEDEDGSLWIGTSEGGLTHYKNGKFKRIGLGQMVRNQVSTFRRCADGSLLVGTRGNGAFRVKDGTVSPLLLPDGVTDILAVHQDGDGIIRIGTNGAGLIEIINGKTTVLTTKNGLPCNQVQVIFQDSKGELWIGTAGGGICRFTNKDRSFQTFDTGHGLAGNNVTAIVEDGQGNFWFATHGKGVSRFYDGTFSTFDTQKGLRSDIVVSLVEGREGCLWIGTEGGGLNHLKDKSFSVLDRSSGLSHHLVFPILADNAGNVYVGTEGGGVNRLHGGKITVYDTSNGLSNNKVMSLYKDGEGGLWVGTLGGGVNRIKDGKIKIYTVEDGLSLNFIWSIMGSADGAVWIGTYGGGLNRFKDGSFTVYNTKTGLGGDSITFILEDSRQNLWVGTYGGGLSRLTNNTITVFDTGSGLSSNIIYCIYEDKQGVIWLGTSGGGLNRYKDGKFVSCQREDGLFDDRVYQILEDNYGDFWMSSNRGIFRTSLKMLTDFCDGKIKKVTCAVYGKSDGMKSVECNGVSQPPGCKTADGKLWFPTQKGAVVIDPDNIRVNTLLPPVEIEKVLVDKQAFDPGLPARLAPGSRTIEIHYAGLSFIDPGKVMYKYKLEGLESDWIDAGTRNTAFYMNLRPGSYRFRVKACNNDGLWNETGASFSFTLNPYFYQTWWFYLAAGFGVFLLVVVGYSWRISQLIRREEELEKLVKQRTEELQKAGDIARKERAIAQKERELAEGANKSKSEFLARMSHEIRTPLNSVIGFSEMLMDTPLKGDQTEYVKSINLSGEALIAIVDDILDFSKIEAGKLNFAPVDFSPETLAIDVCQFILPRIEDKRVEVLCRICERVPAYVKHDPVRFRQVLMNLMSNAAKFTEKGEICLSMDVEEDDGNRLKLRTCIRDTGIGIPREKLDTIFDVFQQADGSITRKFGGTGLGLAICKQIAAHMGGDVCVESEEGKGSRFIFTAWVEKSTETALPVSRPVHPAGEKIHIVDPRVDRQNGCHEGVHILLAEDNAINRRLVEHMLTKAGYQLDMVGNGNEVIEKYTAHPEKYDAILMDVQMPDMDGREATRKIREWESRRTGDDVRLMNKRRPAVNHIPIIAITAESMKGDYEKCIEAGMDDYIAKPIRKEKVFKIIKKWVVTNNKSEKNE